MESRKDAQAIIELLEKINRNLESLGSKMDLITQLQSNLLDRVEPPEKASFENMPLDVATLLSLPDHLRKTAMTICKLGEATADEVSRETARVRAAESDYLNQLVSMGHLKKKRKGRDVYFYIE